MTVLLDKRADITPDVFVRVAWQGEPITLGAQAKAAMQAARQAFLQLIEDPDVVIYGVTTGYGHHASKRLSPEERKAHARRPPQASMTSFGEPLPERVVRGIVLARLTNFIEGHAAITPALAEAVADSLRRPLPPVPGLGNGCPGEIQALSHLFSDLAKGFELGEKDMLSLINGSPCATALLADGATAARRRLRLALEVFALSIEAFKAPLSHFDPVLDALWEDPCEAEALQSLRYWLEGAPAEGRRPYQAPVSWRILPRILGYAARAVAQAEEGAAISLRAVSDNPVYIPPHEGFPLGRIMSTGGYHNGKAAPSLDNLSAAWADLALLADRHTDKMMNGPVSHLPAGLVAEGGGYMGGLAFASAGFAEQARLAAQRTFLPGMESGGYGQNDVPVQSFLSWRKEAEAGRCLDATLALLATVSSQALYITGRQAPPRLRPLVEEVRALVPPLEEQRGLAYEVQGLAERFTARVFAP